jgi:hypothetical protein
MRTSRRALQSGTLGSLRVEVQRALRNTVIKLEGTLDKSSAKRLSAAIRKSLQGNDAQVRLVVAEGTRAPQEHLRILGERLAPHRHRVTVAIPTAPESWSHLRQWLPVESLAA